MKSVLALEGMGKNSMYLPNKANEENEMEWGEGEDDPAGNKYVAHSPPQGSILYLALTTPAPATQELGVNRHMESERD